MSVRSSLGHAEVEQGVQDLRQLRLDDVLAVSSASRSGWVRLNWSFLPERDDDLVDERVAEARDLDLSRSPCAAVRCGESPSVTCEPLAARSVDQTPTTALAASAPATALPSA